MLTDAAIAPDPAQAAVIAELQALYERLLAHKPASGWLSWGRKDRQDIGNLYIWGDVGRGKTMLMDLFFDCLPDSIAAERIHYHAFMTDIHDRLHQQRQQQLSGLDPLAVVAARYMGKLQILCIDEFQVHDIADAMILSRLFTMLLDAGLAVVTTSNRPPDDLYKHGLQRDYFLQFIALIKKRFGVLELASPTDYRMEKIHGHAAWFTPAGNTQELESLFADLITHTPKPAALQVKGRTLTLEKTADGVAWCHFDALCRAALGAEDYAALACEFHTLFLEGIPELAREDRNEAKRFVTLIDTLYDHKVALFCSAETPPERIYGEGDGSFEFQRTVSRLHEMQSEDYLGASHLV